MNSIKEILTINLAEEIKSVIDLEDHNSEIEIQKEIESYIVTEGISQHLYNFSSNFTSIAKETGVWISGFYGSGKSYFGKMLGYIIDNPLINGTPARERFISRLKGISNESLIENSIMGMESQKNRVVFLDVAKQNTDKGLAYTLFTNFLKSLNFRDDMYGYMEFELLIDGRYENFKEILFKNEGQNWDQLKKIAQKVPKVMRKTYQEMGYSEQDYNDMRDLYVSAIKNFSANKLKEELDKYLTIKPDERIVFIFDEASEAISQNKFSLLDLEGVSESLSSLGSRVWTIAIAQEKLDDVINNANISKSQLTKVTDRFKMKLHLESTDVDVIIKSRLLQKKESSFQELTNFYKNRAGLISDTTNLKSSFPTKTENEEVFATYYPFHKYQFEVLQKFLFSSNALVSNQIAARGMIITTFDVLRKQLKDQSLFSFATLHSICKEAQTAPPASLNNKYDTAKKILKDKQFNIDGEKLLKTIHILSNSEIVSPTVDNIVKGYINDIDTFYAIKPEMESALQLLIDSKVLILSNYNYRITSDLEARLLEEMKGFSVPLQNKKNKLIKILTEMKIFQPISSLTDGIESFKFRILSDEEDEFYGGDKNLQIKAVSIYNFTDKQSFIENLKLESQYEIKQTTLVPDGTDFNTIDKLIIEILRYEYMDGKYKDQMDSDKRKIVKDFNLIRDEKVKFLKDKLESAYKNAVFVYMYDDFLVTESSFKSTINDIQRKIVKNVYTKRLNTQLSDQLVAKIFSSKTDALSRIFSGEDFLFFDAHGNFIGENLKVVEEISSRIKSRFVDGKSLEQEFSGAPWGYSFGTIVVTLAALFRAGRLILKYNGMDCHSYQDKGSHEPFNNTTKFRSAAFKAILRTLTSKQKTDTVQALMDLNVNDSLANKISFSINDIELANSIKDFANYFLGVIQSNSESVPDFDSLFGNIVEKKPIIQNFSAAVNENNHIEKVEMFLNSKDEFSSAILAVQKAQKFIKKNLSQLKDFKQYMEEVSSEIQKAEILNENIQQAKVEFLRLYSGDLVKSFTAMKEQVQIIKDQYYKIYKNAVDGMANQYRILNAKVESALSHLQKYPLGLNTHNKSKLELLQKYCQQRIITNFDLEYSTACKNTKFSLSDVLNYTALYSSKENELVLIQNNFVTKEEPVKTPAESVPTKKQEASKPIQKIHFKIKEKRMSVLVYKQLLTEQISLLQSLKDSDEIELVLD